METWQLSRFSTTPDAVAPLKGTLNLGDLITVKEIPPIVSRPPPSWWNPENLPQAALHRCEDRAADGRLCDLLFSRGLGDVYLICFDGKLAGYSVIDPPEGRALLAVRCSPGAQVSIHAEDCMSSTMRDLDLLLANMNPQLADGEYVFCTLEEGRFQSLSAVPLATFREAEGVSVILPRPEADEEDLEYGFVARKIKLAVYSSLDAVGFIAAIAARLTEAGISVNPVAAYHHDYLFVPSDRAEDTMAILEGMIRPAG